MFSDKRRLKKRSEVKKLCCHFHRQTEFFLLVIYSIGDLHISFSEILAPATCIVVSVTASTTQGKPLDADELASVQEACDLAEKMHADRLNMYRLVESRMALIAPNLCEILGAGTAAMIVSKAGG